MGQGTDDSILVLFLGRVSGAEEVIKKCRSQLVQQLNVNLFRPWNLTFPPNFLTPETLIMLCSYLSLTL